MITDKFTITLPEWTFDIVEHNENNVVYYDVTIVKPEDFATMQEMEQPVRMKYDPVTGELKWDSVQDLGMESLESLLSREIINHHL